MQKTNLSSQRLRKVLENPTVVDLIEMGKNAGQVSVDGEAARLKTWPRAFPGRESETAEYTHAAIARFPDGRAIVQVRDKEGLRGYRASAVGEDVTVDLSDATDEALPAALKDLMKIEITSGQGANRHTVNVDVGARKTHELLAFTAEHDPYQKLRVRSDEDHLVLQVRAQAYDPECTLPHVQDTLGGAEGGMNVRLNTDDPQVLAQVGSAWTIARRQVESMREDLEVIHPLQDGETVDMSLSSSEEGRFLARHLGVGGGESKIIFPRNKGAYSVGDAGIELKASSLRAEMLHHVLDVAVGEKAFDGVGVGTRSAYHELFDDVRTAKTYPVEVNDNPSSKNYLLAYMLPDRNLPGMEVDGHYLIRGGTDGGILVNAIKGLRREGELSADKPSDQEVGMYKFLLGMDLKKQPPLLEVGYSLHEPQVDEAVMNVYDQVGMDRPQDMSKSIVIYPRKFLSSAHTRDMISGLELPEELKADYMARTRQIEEEMLPKAKSTVEAGQDPELAATMPRGARMSREEMEALAKRNHGLLTEALGYVCDPELLEACVTDYARLATLHHIATQRTELVEDFVLIQDATQKDTGKNREYQRLLNEGKEDQMWNKLEAMGAEPYSAEKAREYLGLRRQIFKQRSDALKKVHADDGETVDRLNAYDQKIDVTYNARLGIIETQDRLEANLANPESGLAYTTQMPDGQQETFATQLHYMHELMKGYAEGEYNLAA